MKKLSAILVSFLLCLATMSIAMASPLTGDTSHMGLWIAMVGIAILAAVVILILLHKKK